MKQDTVLELRTRHQRWCIPEQGDLLCLLLHGQGIQAQDLCFESPQQCHRLLKRLYLLAAQDYLNKERDLNDRRDGRRKCTYCSPIAILARDLALLKQRPFNASSNKPMTKS